MIIAVIGYKFGSREINVSYDTESKKYYIKEVLKIAGGKGGFSYITESKKEVCSILNNIKKKNQQIKRYGGKRNEK